MREVRKVYSVEELSEAVSLLEKEGLAYKASEKVLLHENPYTANPTDKTYTILVEDNNVQRVLELFSKYYNEAHNTEESFLQQFDNEDLVEILVYPQKNALSDIKEAETILLNRGLSKDKIEKIKEEVISKDNSPAKVKSFALVLGYGSAILGGLFGIIMGLFLIFGKNKHTITGEKYYAHDKKSREEGIYIIILSVVLWSSFIIWLLN